MKRRLESKSKRLKPTRRVKNVRITRKHHHGGDATQPKKKEWYKDDAVIDQIDDLKIGKLMDYIWKKAIQRRVKPVNN